VEERWQRSNPEARARAEDTAAKLQAQIAVLETRAAQAEARGDHRAAREAAASVATYREWLAQAQRTASDLGG
jgi:phage shock protein A